MAYEQVKPFYPKEMGKQKHWCLKNCRLGYRIYTCKYANAKTAMNAGIKNGTYHKGMPPTNIAVPVYTTSNTDKGHVVVCDKGIWYTDGRKYTPAKGSIYGWDEMMDGVRVVKTVSTGFLPTKGYWAKYDNDPRVGRLSAFMYKKFPKYTNKKALGNIYGNFLSASIKQFQKNTGLYPDGMTGSKTYTMLKKYGFKG